MVYDVKDYVKASDLLPGLGIPCVYIHDSLNKKIAELGGQKFPEGLVVDKDDFLTVESLPKMVKGTWLNYPFEKITQLGMTGKIKFHRSFGARINLLKLAGYKKEDFESLVQRENYFLPGAHEFIDYFSHLPKFLLTGGVLDDALACAARLGIEGVIANEVGFDINGKMNGHYDAYVNGNKGEITEALRKYFGFIYGGGDSSTDIGILEHSDFFFAGPKSKQNLIDAAKKHKNAIIVPKNQSLAYVIRELEKQKIKV